MLKVKPVFDYTDNRDTRERSRECPLRFVDRVEEAHRAAALGIEINRGRITAWCVIDSRSVNHREKRYITVVEDRARYRGKKKNDTGQRYCEISPESIAIILFRSDCLYFAENVPRWYRGTYLRSVESTDAVATTEKRGKGSTFRAQHDPLDLAQRVQYAGDTDQLPVFFFFLYSFFFRYK